MPKYAIRGGDVILRCDHTVSNEQLHKVEWHKAEKKIFQYVKGRIPPFRKFPDALSGATVNRTGSNDKQLQLSNLNFSASGSYSCIVSMETPIFSKDSERHVLTIIEPQADNPNITFTKDRYEVGDTLEVNCTSAPSRPPAHITWYINEMKAPENLTKSYFNGKIHGYYDQIASATKQLSIEVSDLHVGENGLRLTCMSTIPGYITDDETYADKREHSIRVIVENVEPPKKPNEQTQNDIPELESNCSWSAKTASSAFLIFLSFYILQ
nr:uncharacterized protein LOC111414667 [Onthophagus taurus]